MKKEPEMPETRKTPSQLDLDVAAAFVEMGTRDAAAAVDAGLARETLISLMFRHADLLASTQQSRQSTTLFELATHLSGVDVDTLFKQEGIETLTAQGKRLFASGRFHLACKIYEYLVRAMPEDHEVHVSLASIYFWLDREEESHRLLTDFYQRYPAEFVPASEEGTPVGTILKISGYDKTRFKISPTSDGGFKRFRRGGHFMLRYLLDEDIYDVHGYTIADNNIADAPPTAPFDLLLNTIADADTEYRSLQSLDRYLEQHPAPVVINHPANVLNTTRDGNYRRLNQLPGLRFPKTKRYAVVPGGHAALAAQIEDAPFAYPLIVRETGTHTAVSTALVADRSELESYLANVTGDSVYAIEFVENASNAGHYTKMRFFAIDGLLYPIVHHIDEVWNVHGGNRKTFMAGHDWMVEREKQFLADPASVIGASAYALLQTLPDIIGLEFFGFDFTLLENGDILIFELNPAMRHSFTHAENFPYMQPYLKNVSNAFAAMVKNRVMAAQKA